VTPNTRDAKHRVAAASWVVGLISGLLDVAIVVLLLQKPSNAFFKRR
jgi:uncharacterized PurR-regulated membrane protein YhhQ (DUF165 family)